MSYNDDIKMLIDAQDLTLPPPEREPQRQYYFIKKCREIVKKKSEELGRPLYACSVCMGCQMVATKVPPFAIKRRAAVEQLGFAASKETLIGGHDKKVYSDYYVLERV